MDRRQILLGGVAAPSLLAPAAAGAQGSPQPLPAELFFSHDSMSGAQLSPDGRRVAVRVGSSDAPEILAVVELATMKVQPVARFADNGIAHFQWVNDERLVFNLHQGRRVWGERDEAAGLYAVNADGSRFKLLAFHNWVRGSEFTDPRQLHWSTRLLPQLGSQSTPNVFVVQPQERSVQGFDYFRILRLDTVTGLTREIETPPNAFAWLVDPADRLRAVFTARDDRAAIHWRDADERWRRLREFERFGGGDLSLAHIDHQGTVYALARAGRETTAVHTFDPATDTFGSKPLLAQARYDLNPDFVADDRKLLGLRIEVDAETTVWFDDAMRALQARVDKLLPATTNLIDPPRRGESPFVLVRAEADVQPTQYHVFDRAAGKLTALGGRRPAVRAAQMSTMDAISYKARDGLDIPGYLTLPRGRAKPHPLVVLVHGGPWLRGGSWRWQPDVQFLAARGYAVLQPEFRGSTGFGDRHFRAGFRQWGLAMQDDLADGARWAVAQGIADGQRIAIMGGSYGGYAALMGLVKDGDLFRCGISCFGVSDILLLYEPGWSNVRTAWRRHGLPAMVGDREKDRAQLEATSPLRQATRLRNPVLLAHGKLDPRVPVEHSERLRDALGKHNPNVEWALYDKEGHGFSLPDNEADFMQRVERFLAKHLS